MCSELWNVHSIHHDLTRPGARRTEVGDPGTLVRIERLDRALAAERGSPEGIGRAR